MRLLIGWVVWSWHCQGCCLMAVSMACSWSSNVEIAYHSLKPALVHHQGKPIDHIAGENGCVCWVSYCQWHWPVLFARNRGFGFVVGYDCIAGTVVAHVNGTCIDAHLGWRLLLEYSDTYIFVGGIVFQVRKLVAAFFDLLNNQLMKLQYSTASYCFLTVSFLHQNLHVRSSIWT